MVSKTPQGRSSEQKRPAAGLADARATKRFKVFHKGAGEETEPALLDSVVGALDEIQATSGVSDHGREMLRLMAPGCLLVPACSRHEYQQSVAEMLREVLAGADSDMQKCLQGAASKVEEASSTRDECESNVQTTREVVDSNVDAVAKARQRFAADNATLEKARKELDVVKVAQAPVEAKVSETKELSRALEDVLQNHYAAFIEGTDGKLEQHGATMTSLLVRLSVEESLRRAFAPLAKVKPEARGMFDKAALEQLGHVFREQADKTKTSLESCDEELAAHNTEVAAAQVAVQEARQKQRQSANALRLAEGRGWEVEGTLGAAEQGLREAKVNFVSATSRRRAEELDLDAFRSGPLAALEELYQRGRQPEESTTQGDDAAPTKEAVDATVAAESNDASPGETTAVAEPAAAAEAATSAATAAEAAPSEAAATQGSSAGMEVDTRPAAASVENDTDDIE